MKAADYRQRLILGWGEKQLQAQVVQLAKVQGWMCYHTWDSRRSEPGWPDLAMVHPERGFILRELKAEKGRVSKAQHTWLHQLIAADQDAAIWRPRDWISGRIQRELGQESQNTA